MDKMIPLTAVIEREGDGYVAVCLELDIVSQGNTVEEARLNFVEAVEGFFKAASQSEVHGFVEARRKGSHIIMQKHEGETTITGLYPTMKN